MDGGERIVRGYGDRVRPAARNSRSGPLVGRVWIGGFTLIELLVVTAIVGLLAGLLASSLAGARREGRRAVCLSNLRQTGVATAMYLDDNRESFWRYFERRAGGLRWWFGFEPGGPATGQRNRPLDKRQGVLAGYLRSVDDGLQCPEFPYDSGLYFPKFAARSASYGFNLHLGPAGEANPPRRRSELAGRASGVFVFADGVHFDFSPGINEGHYIEYVSDLTSAWRGGGFGHFRHNRRASVQYLDGHVDGQRLRGPAYVRFAPGGPAGNLSSSGGGAAIYAMR